MEPRRTIPRRVASAVIVGMVRTLGEYGRSGPGKVRTKAGGSRSMHDETGMTPGSPEDMKMDSRVPGVDFARGAPGRPTLYRYRQA